MDHRSQRGSSPLADFGAVVAYGKLSFLGPDSKEEEDKESGGKTAK
jgi:hypothetical protein